jgi:hypothetical protein
VNTPEKRKAPLMRDMLKEKVYNHEADSFWRITKFGCPLVQEQQIDEQIENQQLQTKPQHLTAERRLFWEGNRVKFDRLIH